MKKILVFIDWYLPGYKAGGPIRSMANMVAHLADSFQFLVVTRNNDYMDNKPYKVTQVNKWTKLSENQMVYYIPDELVSIKKMKQIIKETDFDIAYINGIYSFYFSLLPLILLRYFSNKKTIVAPRGMLSKQGLGVKSKRKMLFVVLARIIGLYKKAVIHVTSPKELSDIEQLKLNPKALFPGTNFPPKFNKSSKQNISKKSGELRLISIARISPEKNTLFAINCLKDYGYEGKIEFDLYGSVYNESYWEVCKKNMKELPSNVTINYKGELDNTLIFNILNDYHFLFLPSKGENFGHSILESLMAGCPVIISDQTPWKELEKENAGWELSLLRSDLFAEKIQFSVNLSGKEYLKMSDSARKHAENKTNNQETLLAYKQLFS